MHHDRNHEHRPASKHGNANNHMQQNMYDAVQPTFSQMNMQRTPSMDSSTTYDSFMAPAPNMMAPGMNQQAAQYQQMLANAARQNQYYNSQMGTMNGGYSSPAPSMTTMDSFRNMQSTPMGAPGLSGSPLMPQAGFGQAGFNPMMNQQMYGQYQMGYMPAQQMQVGAGRRGRVGQDRQCRWNIRKLTEKQR
jgi:protein JSN1